MEPVQVAHSASEFDSIERFKCLDAAFAAKPGSVAERPGADAFLHGGDLPCDLGQWVHSLRDEDETGDDLVQRALAAQRANPLMRAPLLIL